MKQIDLFKFALTGLKRRTARTFLTVLGVIIGTLCIVLMIAIGVSTYQQFEQSMLENQRLTEITINDYSGSGMSGAGTGVVSTGITDSILASVQEMDHVDIVSPVISLPMTITAGKYTGVIDIRGVNPDLLDLEFDEGGMFADQGAVVSVVLGGLTVRYLTDPDNPVYYDDYDYSPDINLLDTEIEMTLGYSYSDLEMEESEIPRSQKYKGDVSGITKKSFSDDSYYGFMDIEAARRIMNENRELAQWLNISFNSYQEAKIIVDDISNVEQVLEEVRKLGFETRSPTEDILWMQEQQALQQGQLFAIGFISLLVSAIGIANTMYANILERRRDIGVMKVVGMKIRQIRSLFLMESSMIGFLGGLIGIGISYIVVMIMNTGSGEMMFLGMSFSSGMTISIPLWLSFVALVIAVGVGVVSGIYPAYKATKMSPLEAMRNGK